MTTGMRILLISSFFLGALWLHFTLCEWHMSHVSGWPSVRLAGWGTEEFKVAQNAQYVTHSGFGLFAKFGVTKAEAVVAGVALPIALLVACVLFLLKWRRDRLVGMGACPSCLHQRDPSSAARCPECGWLRNESSLC